MIDANESFKEKQSEQPKNEFTPHQKRLIGQWHESAHTSTPPFTVKRDGKGEQVLCWVNRKERRMNAAYLSRTPVLVKNGKRTVSNETRAAKRKVQKASRKRNRN